jgi:hypothetical protein
MDAGKRPPHSGNKNGRNVLKSVEMRQLVSAFLLVELDSMPGARKPNAKNGVESKDLPAGGFDRKMMKSAKNAILVVACFIAQCGICIAQGDGFINGVPTMPLDGGVVDEMLDIAGRVDPEVPTAFEGRSTTARWWSSEVRIRSVLEVTTATRSQSLRSKGFTGTIRDGFAGLRYSTSGNT